MKRRIRHRLRMIHAALTLKPIAGAEDDPPADPPPADPPADSAKTYTTEQINKIVQERLARDRRDRPSDEEITQLREAATKLQEIEEANASELEKAQKRADEAEARAEKATLTANTALRRAAITAAATQEGADPDVVHALLADKGFKVKKDDEEIEVSVSDSGEVVGVGDAVKAIVEAKNLGGAPADPPPGDGGARTPVAPKDLDAQIKEAEKKGDFTTAMELNNRKLLAVKQQQQDSAQAA